MATKKTNTRKTAAKKNSRSPRKKASVKKQSSPIKFFFGGIFLTLAALFTWVLFTQPELLKNLFPTKANKEQTVQTKPSENVVKQASSEKTPARNSSTDDQQLDYHQILTNKELAVEKDPVSTTTSTRRYIMQCAASKVLAQAEAMKAEIAFMGLQANISEKNGWHRVQLGPYSSKRAAESDRHKLQNNDFNDCRIW